MCYVESKISFSVASVATSNESSSYNGYFRKKFQVVKRTKSDTGNQTEEPSSTSSSSGRNGFELVPTSEDFTEKIRAMNEEVCKGWEINRYNYVLIL